MKATKLIKTLTPEQLEFIQTKQMQGAFRADKWLHHFQQLVKLDEQVDQARPKMQKTANIFLIVSLISTFVGIFTIILLPLPVIFWAIFIIYRVKYKKLKKIDIDNTFRNFIVPVVALLKEEIKNKEKIQLQIDLSDKCTKDRLVNEIPNTNKYYPKINEKYYQSTTLLGKTTLQNDVVFSWKVTDLIRKREIRKKNPRGKIKFKKKYKVKHLVEVSFTFPKSTFECDSTNLNGMKYSDKGDSFILKARGKTYSPSLEQQVDPGFFLKVSTGVLSKVNVKKQ